MSVWAVALLLFAVVAVVFGVLAAVAQQRGSAIVHAITGVLLVLVAFGLLP